MLLKIRNDRSGKVEIRSNELIGGKAMKGIKLTVIGGGSSYTPELVEGVILHYKTLPVTEIVLVDIMQGEEKVQITTSLVQRMVHKAGIDIKVSYTLNRKEGLIGADFVVAQLRVGGLDARAIDERIPLKYGVVGQETTGPGGCFKALRTIPVMLSICEDMQEVCPDAWLINFTNPAGIVTEAVNRYTKIKCIGLCNVPINMIHDAATRLNVPTNELDCRFVGLNHLSMMHHAYYKGKDQIAKIVKVKQTKSIVKNIEKKDAIEVLQEKMVGLLSPYMQYFYLEKDMVAEEIRKVFSGEGTRAEQVKIVENQLFEIYKDLNLDIKPEALSKRGGSRYSEAAIALIHSIYTDRGDIQVVNVPNGTLFPELPIDAVVEVNCVINKNGAIPISSDGLPEVIKGLVCQVKAYERLTIEAAIEGNRDKLLLALMNNPLIHQFEDAQCMMDDMLEAHKNYLTKFYE